VTRQVKTQPRQPTQTCSVVAGTGAISNDDVSGIAVTCSANLTTLYAFTGRVPGSADGVDPNGSLVQGPDGNLYGTTQGSDEIPGTSQVFRIKPAGEETTLYSFPTSVSLSSPGGTDAGLILASDGNFYGTTTGDGIGSDVSGTVYRFSPTGSISTIYTFSGLDEGDLPVCGGVIQGSDGLLHGVAFGNQLFGLTTTGTVATQAKVSGSSFSCASLVQARDGSLYGTSSDGGMVLQRDGGSSQGGMVYKAVPGSGQVTTIYAFGKPPEDASNPMFPLVEGKDGNLYGSTEFGGIPSAVCPTGCGAIFRVTPAGV